MYLFTCVYIYESIYIQIFLMSSYTTVMQMYTFTYTLGESLQLTAESLSLPTPEEQALAKQLMKLDEVLEEVARDLYPNRLCEYLFELSQRFNKFYECCPVLKAETMELRY
jgi:arginyl-tRNA synthetase